MKYLLTVFFIAGCVIVTKGQTEIRTAQGADTKIYTELLASSEKVVKGAPFSAEVTNESVQTLSDGNRIVRTSNSKMFRDAEGRFRRDGAVNSGASVIGYYSSVMTTTITDPVTGTKYFLDDKNKTVRKWAIKAPLEINGEAYEKMRKLKEVYSSDAKMTPQAMMELEKALAVQGKAMTIVTTPSAQSPAAQAELEKALVGKIAVASTVPGSEITVLRRGEQGSGYAFNNESLGTKNIEGVEAEGTRNITTIPAGAIGNERPIEIVYEKWYSKDLQLIVYSRHSDPRYGDQVYKLTNISRSDPDPSVFTVPGDYKLQAEGYAPAAPRSAYRIATTASPSVQGMAPTPAAAPTVTVKAAAAPKKPQ